MDYQYKTIFYLTFLTSYGMFFGWLKYAEWFPIGFIEFLNMLSQMSPL